MSEDLELLQAAIAVAVADQVVRRSEMGVLQGLAERAGVGRASFDAMVEAARRDPTFAGSLLMKSRGKAKSAVRLLVAQARIDGEISTQERQVIAQIATALGLSGDELHEAFRAGVRKADEVRGRRAAT